MQALNIAIVHGSLHTFGGAERIIMQLTHYLIEQGHHVDVFTYAISAEARSQFLKLGSNVTTLCLPLININDSKSFSLAFLGWRLRNKLQHYDIINVHNYPATVWLGYASKFGRIPFPPIVWACHEPPREVYEDYKPRKNRQHDKLVSIDQQSVRLFKQIICNSSHTASMVSKYYSLQPTIKHFGVSITATSTRSSSLAKPIVFGTVSRLEPIKNIDFILQALALFKQEHPQLPFTYEIVGTGIEESRLQALVITLNLQQHVRFLGFVSHQDLANCYRRWAFTVFCPKDEPLGLIPLEAASYGIATIGANQGGIKETVMDRHTGLLVDLDKPSSLVTALSTLVFNRALCETYGQQAWTHVKTHFDFQLTGAYFEELFTSLVPNKS